MICNQFVMFLIVDGQVVVALRLQMHNRERQFCVEMIVAAMILFAKSDCQTYVCHTENFCVPVHVDGNSANTHPRRDVCFTSRNPTFHGFPKWTQSD